MVSESGLSVADSGDRADCDFSLTLTLSRWERGFLRQAIRLRTVGTRPGEGICVSRHLPLQRDFHGLEGFGEGRHCYLIAVTSL